MTTEKQDSKNNRAGASLERLQYSTFYIADRWYGIDVKRVQEVVKPMAMTSVPLAPKYVRGLINLRGQVATAVGLRELFTLADQKDGEPMNVVCKHEGNLLSLQVDAIGDVVEVSHELYEVTPQTVSENIRQFMSGIYKMPGQLLSILEIDEVAKFLNNKAA